MNDFILNIRTFTSQKLCEVIINSRYLGIMKEEAEKSMIELAYRRYLGDDFKFEDFITDELKKLPKFSLDFKQISPLLNTIKNYL